MKTGAKRKSARYVFGDGRRRKLKLQRADLLGVLEMGHWCVAVAPPPGDNCFCAFFPVFADLHGESLNKRRGAVPGDHQRISGTYE